MNPCYELNRLEKSAGLALADCSCGLHSWGMHPLDNPSWHALATLQSQFAMTAEHALRFRPEICVHGGFPDVFAELPSAEAWASLASFGREPVSLFSLHPLTPPAGWTTTRSVELVEMVQEGNGFRATEAEKKYGASIVELSPEDLPQMSALYEATRPGRKLYPRLMELGGFLGIKQGDLLIAMACLRLDITCYREISTVATLPEHTGRGYASALVGELARRIRNGGKQAFLTVNTRNARARAIYERLGFRSRVNLCSTTFRREVTHEDTQVSAERERP
jgi:ribosomal protein S18 acetylase RimI-like enzyme